MKIETLYEIILNCFPLVYDQYEGDFFDFITEKTDEYVEQVNALDADDIKSLNSAFDALPKDNKPVNRLTS